MQNINGSMFKDGSIIFNYMQNKVSGFKNGSHCDVLCVVHCVLWYEPVPLL